MRDLRIHNINNEKIIIRKPGNQEFMNINFIILLYCLFPAFPTESDLELANRVASGDQASL